MRLSRVLAGLAISVVSVSAVANDKTPDQYWREVGMNLSFVERENVIRDSKCEQSGPHLAGCMSALNVLATKAAKELQVVPSSMLQGPRASEFGKLVKSFGAFSVVEYKDAPIDSSLTARQYYEQASRKNDEARALLDRLAKSRTPSQMENIYAFVKAQAQAQLKITGAEPSTAAAMINLDLISSQDAHAHIDPVAQIEDMSRGENNSLVGIGIQIDLRQDKAIVIRAINDAGPAKTGNLMPGDVLLAVDDVQLKSMTIDQVVSKIRGRENTNVKILILRGGKQYQVVLTRKRIVTENVETKLVDIGNSKKGGYIRLRSFMDARSCLHIINGVNNLTAEGAKGFILDLRNNGGGLIDQAVCIASIFAGQKVIVRVQDFTTRSEVAYNGSMPAATALPLIVLINSGSASASELVSGALQDHGRAWILGDRSFGKGTVQNGFPYANGIYKFMTTARFHQPSGRTNQIYGILPDIEVPFKPNATLDEKFALREGDLFPNAVKPAGAVWTQTRPNEVANLKACMDRSSRAEAMYTAHAGTQIPLEYEVLKAQEALGCVTE